MVVRIRFARRQGASALRSAVAALLTLVGVACFVLGAWVLFAELGWAGEFVWQQGTFSHWQVWMACGVVAQLASFRLTRVLPMKAQTPQATLEKAL